MLARMRLLLIVALAGCAHHAPTHFSYGEPWGGTCASGREQSPINLHAAGGFAPKLEFEYWPSRTRLINNGHTVQLEYDPGSALTVDGVRYALVQMHFHHPSEHTLDGTGAALELHLVHKSADGKLAVVGVLLREGAANRWLEAVLHALPSEGERAELDARINAADLLPASRRVFAYRGSLTTPPCSEGVSWFVMQSPSEISADQLAPFARLYPDNHRPPVPLNGRSVTLSE
jgi:carbonic anhydrase